MSNVGSSNLFLTNTAVIVIQVVQGHSLRKLIKNKVSLKTNIFAQRQAQSVYMTLFEFLTSENRHSWSLAMRKRCTRHRGQLALPKRWLISSVEADSSPNMYHKNKTRDKNTENVSSVLTSLMLSKYYILVMMCFQYTNNICLFRPKGKERKFK